MQMKIMSDRSKTG